VLGFAGVSGLSSPLDLALPVRWIARGSAGGGLGGLAAVTEEARGAGESVMTASRRMRAETSRHSSEAGFSTTLLFSANGTSVTCSRSIAFGISTPRARLRGSNSACRPSQRSRCRPILRVSSQFPRLEAFTMTTARLRDAADGRGSQHNTSKHDQSEGDDLLQFGDDTSEHETDLPPRPALTSSIVVSEIFNDLVSEERGTVGAPGNQLRRSRRRPRRGEDSQRPIRSLRRLN
jgi:hypothetical protein